jgi:predicted ATPase
VNLRERSSELEQISELLTQSRAGNGRVAVVSAAAGMGKTALLHAFWGSLVRSDICLLTASCLPSDRNLPFAMLAELLQSPALEAKDSSRAMKLLDDCALLLEDPLRPGVRAAWAERGFARLISQLSERRTVVICVDDVHHADPGSIAQLLRLVRRMHSARVLTVLTERTRMAKVYSPLHTELLGHPHVRSIRLDPLSQRGVREMISASTHTDNGAARAADLHASTGGSPLLVQAMLQDLGQRGQAAGENTPEATAFGHTVLSCLHSTDPTTLAVARATALLDVAADPTLLSLLLDLPLEMVTAVLAELHAMGLVHGCQLRHRAARQVILGDMAPDDRLSSHVRAARLLFETRARPSTVAGHLLRANSATEPWMVKTLVDAADAELDNDARHARAYLELARRFSASDPRR